MGEGMIWVDKGGEGKVKGVGLFIGSILNFAILPWDPSPRSRTLRPALRNSWAHPCCLKASISTWKLTKEYATLPWLIIYRHAGGGGGGCVVVVIDSFDSYTALLVWAYAITVMYLSVCSHLEKCFFSASVTDLNESWTQWSLDGGVSEVFRNLRSVI